MEQVQLGNSGLRVSRLVFGTLTFGQAQPGAPIGATSGEAARTLVDIAIDSGINAFDTANSYSHGAAETVLGETLAGRRDRVLIFSKAGFPTSDRPNDRGASRPHLLAQVDASLRRLRTDYLDLYFVHLWDGLTPVEETAEVMSGLVHAGKIRYWGVSNYSAWTLTSTVLTARARGLLQPVCHQLYYTPEAREAEYELLPAGLHLGVSAMIWSPLAQGVLSGKIDRNRMAPPGSRQGTPGWPEPWIADRERLYRVIDALREVAAEHQASIPQIAIAWIRHRPAVGPIVIGARNQQQLLDNLGAADLSLTPDQLARIEAIARPAPLYPFWHRARFATERAAPAELEYLQGHRQTLGLD